MNQTTLYLLLFCSLIFSQEAPYFQQDVEYKINIALNPETKQYSGSETISYTNNSSDELSFIWIHLYPNAYKNSTTPFAKQQERFGIRAFHFSEEKDRGYIDITSVKSENNVLKWEYKDGAIDEMKVLLAQPLAPGETVLIDLNFNARFPKVFSRQGHFSHRYFAATQWYPKVVVYDKEGWHPDSYLDMGEFYGEFGTFDVSITLPENYIIDATGIREPHTIDKKIMTSVIQATEKLTTINNKTERTAYVSEWRNKHRSNTDLQKLKTVRFHAKNVHDFAWFAGEDFMVFEEKTKNNVLVRTLALPQNAYEWKDVNRYTKQTLSFYGKRVGEYQYPKATVVDGSLSAGGGMEYPMITIISTQPSHWHNLLEMVVMHEVGHNWFYGMLGSNERSSTFLDEGLNSFHEAKYMNYYHGKKNLTNFENLLGKLNILEDVGEWFLGHLSYGSLVHKNNDQPLNLRAEAYTRDSYSGVNYQKSGFLLEALEWYLGEDTFIKGMHAYFDKWNGKHPTENDFWVSMQSVTDKDLSKIRNEWMNTTTYNDFVLDHVETTQTAAGYKTVIHVANKGTMKHMPAPVNLVTLDGDTLEATWNTTEPVTMVHSSPIKDIEVNLNRRVFETNYLNNKSVPNVKFSFLNPMPSFDSYRITYAPYIDYEYFVDGPRLGFFLDAGNFIINQHHIMASVYYGTRSGNMGYSAKYSDRYPGLFFNYSDLKLSVYNQNGLQRFSGAIETVYSNPNELNSAHKFELGAQLMDIHETDYLDPQIYTQTHKYATIDLNYNFSGKEMLYRYNSTISYEKSISPSDEFEYDYSKLQLNGDFRYYFGLNRFVEIDGFFGHIFGTNAPSQEQIYAGGDIDPKMENFALARRGSFSALNNYISDQPGLNMFGLSKHGSAYRSGNTGMSLGLRIQPDLPYVPQVYGRLAKLSHSLDTLKDTDLLAEAGFVIDGGIVKFVLPVYVNHPLGNENAFDFRWALKFNLPF